MVRANLKQMFPCNNLVVSRQLFKDYFILKISDFVFISVGICGWGPKCLVCNLKEACEFRQSSVKFIRYV